MLLYIHIPFCRRKCGYCAFYSVEHSQEMEEFFLQALEQEIRLRSKEFGRQPVSSIYLGGGTPTIISVSSLSRIIDLAGACFPLEPFLEFTIEANPETLQNPSTVNAIGKLGVNRISLGVQSLDDDLLFVLGRGHSSVQAARASRLILDSGIENLSLDFIWGLPGQTLRHWLDTLKSAVRLRPKHVSCYGLTLEPDTPVAQQFEQGKLIQEPDAVLAQMYVLGAEFLESEGFLQYEISNFARMGYSCGHNKGYWEGTEFLGFGPSAVSYVQGRRWVNPSNVKDYASTAHKNFSDLNTEEIQGSKLINERVMLALRTSKGLNLKDYMELTGEDFCVRFRHLIRPLHQNNLIRLANGYLRLTKNGMLVSNSIIERFIS